MDELKQLDPIMPEFTEAEIKAFEKLARFDADKLQTWQERLKTATREVEYWTVKAEQSGSVQIRMVMHGKK